jgi:peptide chain release factor 3
VQFNRCSKRIIKLKGATSDFMEIERQRGISVSTSVLAFNYKTKNKHSIPGHKDFLPVCRTLTAVDSVIVVIDVAKELRNKLMVAVCRMRKIPIIVFINKMDREGKDAFDLMDDRAKARTHCYSSKFSDRYGLRFSRHL